MAQTARSSGIKIVLLIGVISNLGPVSSLSFNEVAESCPGNFITRDYNNWVFTKTSKDTIWYMPMTSKYHALMLSLNLHKSPSFYKIDEVQLENSCIAGLMKTEGNLMTVNIIGYDGANDLLFTLIPTSVANLARLRFPLPDVLSGGSYISIALSNNESYIVYDVCYDNGLRSFVVISTKPNLDENSLNVIRAHMKSLGFDEKNFLYLNFDSCMEKDGKLVSSDEYLPQPLKLNRVPLHSNSIFAQHLTIPQYVVG